MATKECLVFDIDTQTYHHRVFLNSSESVTFERRHIIPTPTKEVDTFGTSWLLAVALVPHESLFVKYRQTTYGLSGLRAFFLPAFSVVQWHLRPATLFWRGFMSDSLLGSEFPKKAISFTISPAEIPTNHDEALKLVRKQAHFTIIEKNETNSYLAQKTKTYIDQHFCDDLPIHSIANELHCHRVVLGREFKKCYGLAPIDYRNRLRIFHSTKLLRQGLDVTSTAYQSGFSHISRFQDNFKKVMKVKPIDFCLQKKKPVNPLINHGGINQWKEFLLQGELDLSVPIPPTL